MKKIVSIGEVLIDSYSKSGKIKNEIGGASFNVACSIAALKNNESFFMGSVSNDELGQEIQNLIEKYNIKKDFIQITDKKTTIAKVTLNADKDRTFEFIRSSDADFEIKIVEKQLLDKIDFIHFGSATCFLPGKLRESYFHLLNFAIENDINFSFDPNFRDTLWKEKRDVDKFKKECEVFLSKANLIKLSDNELLLLTESVDEKEGLNKIIQINEKALICITRGSKSTMCAWKKQIFYVDIFKCDNLVDTTGAGDSFVSKLISDFVSENINLNTDLDTIKNIVSNSNKFANYSVQYYGALTFLDFI